MSYISQTLGRRAKAVYQALPHRAQRVLRTFLMRTGLPMHRPYSRPGYIHHTAILDRRELIHVDPTATISEYCIVRAHLEPVEIGQKSSLGPFSVIYGGHGVRIAENVMIGPHVVIAAGNHNFAQLELPMQDAGGMTKGPIIIEEDVWIGALVTICDGVRLSKGCVIGAGATVTKSTEPYGIYGGVPARLIGSRLNLRPEHIEAAERARQAQAGEGTSPY